MQPALRKVLRTSSNDKVDRASLEFGHHEVGGSFVHDHCNLGVPGKHPRDGGRDQRNREAWTASDRESTTHAVSHSVHFNMRVLRFKQDGPGARSQHSASFGWRNAL
jgi:hypothetical protein